MTTHTVSPTADLTKTLDVPDQLDGRRMRTERGREAVIEALLAIYEEGVSRPSAAAIALRAGVSERSVFRYFDDRDSLIQAIVTFQTERIGHLYAKPNFSGTTTERINALVELRLTIYDKTNNVVRAAASEIAESQQLIKAFDFRRQVLSQQIDKVFAPELAALAPAEAAELRAALDVAASVEQIDYLRHHKGNSVEFTRSIVKLTLHALLGINTSN